MMGNFLFARIVRSFIVPFDHLAHEYLQRSFFQPGSSNKSLLCDGFKLFLVSKVHFQQNAVQEKHTIEQKKLVDFIQLEGLSPEEIANCPQLFKLPLDVVYKRLHFVKQVLHLNDNTAIMYALKMNEANFKRFIYLINHEPTKIQEFSSLLYCSYETQMKTYMKYPFLVRSKVSTLRPKIKLMKEWGVSDESLLNDLWILSYTTDKLTIRLQLLKKLDLVPIKTWMLRCNEENVWRAYHHREANRKALVPHSSNIEYICQRLGIEQEQIYHFASRHPQVMKVHVAKLKEIFDFLFLEGFSALQIYSTPRILCHSLSTIQSRLKILREKNCKPHTLSILCKNRSDFNNFISKLDLYNNLVNNSSNE